MGYAISTLAEGEDVIRKAHFSWTYNIAAWLWFAFGAAPSVVMLAHSFARGAPPPALATPFWWAAFTAFALGALLTVNHYCRKWSTVIVITNARLIYKKGIVARTSFDISVEKIEEVDLNQSFLGRLFGFGRLIVRGEGIGLLELPPIAEPVGFLRDLEEAAEKKRDRLNEKGGHEKHDAPENLVAAE